MPDRITFDEALSSRKAAGITFDEAFERHQQRVGAHQQQQAQRTERGALMEQQLGDQLPRDITRAPGEMPSDPYLAQRSPRVEAPEKSNFGASLKAGLVEDPNTKRRLIAESLFPGDPNGMQRVGFADGEPVFVDDHGQLRRVSGSLVSTGANAIANAPELAGAAVGSFATGNPVTGTAVGGMGGRALKRGISQLAFDEPATPVSVATEMAVEGATNLAAGVVGKGVAKFGDRGKVVDFSPTNRATAEQTRARVKQTTGIDLDLAQASGDRKLIALRAYGARYPGKSAELFQAADELAEGKFEAASQRMLNSIASSKPSEIVGKEGINTAQMVIGAARKNVSHSVRPLYEAAYKAVPEVSSGTKQGAKILDFLKLPYFQQAFSAGQRLRALETGSAVKPKTKTVESLIKRDAEAGTYESAQTVVQSTETGARRITSTLASGEKRNTPDGLFTKRTETKHSDITRPSLAELDYTKRALDEQIEAMLESGQRQRARALTTKRNEFVAALDELPDQAWQAARKEYGELAKSQIEPLENGVIGVIAKIKDPNSAKAAAKIFSDPNLSPQALAQARAAISKQNPEAWNGLVRQWMSQKLNQAMKETQTASVTNTAGKFRQAVFGTPADKQKAAVMLPSGAVKDFEDLMFAAEKLASTPIAGSNTMRDTEMKDQLKGTGAVIFRWFTSPRQAVVNAAEQRAIEEGTSAITEALLDPAKRSQLRRVVKMAPSTRQAILLTSILTSQATKVAAQSEADLMPPALEAARSQ